MSSDHCTRNVRTRIRTNCYGIDGNNNKNYDHLLNGLSDELTGENSGMKMGKFPLKMHWKMQPKIQNSQARQMICCQLSAKCVLPYSY